MNDLNEELFVVLVSGDIISITTRKKNMFRINANLLHFKNFILKNFVSHKNFVFGMLM